LEEEIPKCRNFLGKNQTSSPQHNCNKMMSKYQQLEKLQATKLSHSP